MTKDIQFNRLKAYNLTDLVDICMDDSKLYSQHCIDVSHNRNYHLFTNQKSRNIYNDLKIKQEQIIQLSETKFLAPVKLMRINFTKLTWKLGCVSASKVV